MIRQTAIFVKLNSRMSCSEKTNGKKITVLYKEGAQYTRGGYKVQFSHSKFY